MKKKLDNLVKIYETKDFIKDDPIQFPHLFKNKKDIEISAFISAMFAYGKREQFIKKLDELFKKIDMQPYNFVENFEKEKNLIKDINYRFCKNEDLYDIFAILNKLYTKDKSSLEELFSKGTQVVCDYFYKNNPNNCPMGFCFMISNPSKGGAQKRYNMFLRWMIRKGPVDLGIWDFKKPSELLIPLDVHVARLSREYNLLKRNSNDIKAVIELTDKLKEFDSSDPIKYDFALFGLGVNKGHYKDI
ncbi:MAG: TIGR02757 family protein [Cyanobacteria bacterium SIG30]|nr:TIGR02757 family protein [Cyanobacteria bacterium SIG30]